MNTAKETESTDLIASLTEDDASQYSRRSFFKRAAVVGATGLVAAGGLSALASAVTKPRIDLGEEDKPANGFTSQDHAILVGAEIAEALAVTTYTNIINVAPFFTRLASDDQGYLMGARQEEMSHYLLEQEVTMRPTPYSSFFYPVNMFADAQTTLNTLVALEDAFIAAYLVGVRNFSTPELRVTAARIMGIESDHRTLARVVAPGVSTTDGGPIEMITGLQGVAESVDPPNNNGYERTQCWNRIGQAISALLPFVDINAAEAAGFDTSKTYAFEPFTPTLPNPLGDFFSFKGC